MSIYSNILKHKITVKSMIFTKTKTFINNALHISAFKLGLRVKSSNYYINLNNYDQ